MNDEQKQYSYEAFEALRSQLFKYYYKHKDGKFKNYSLEDKIAALKKFADIIIEQFDYEGQVDPELLENCINMLVTTVDADAIVFEDGYTPWLDENRS